MSNVLNGIAGLLVAVAPNYVSLLVFRTLYGFGVKGGWVAGYVLSKSNPCENQFLMFPSRDPSILIWSIYKRKIKYVFSVSHRDCWGGVQTDGGGHLSDVLQRWHPHPPAARLLHHGLALAAGRHHHPLHPLPLLLLVRHLITSLISRPRNTIWLTGFGSFSTNSKFCAFGDESYTLHCQSFIWQDIVSPSPTDAYLVSG